jgi:hypothetical protein
LWTRRNSKTVKRPDCTANYPFRVNKIAPLPHYATVRNDSDKTREKEGNIMAKAMKKKTAAKKKPAKKVASKRRATKRRR